MSEQRKRYPDSFKHKVVVEAFTSGKTMAEVAAENDIAPSLVTEWKEEFISGGESWELKKADRQLKEKDKAIEDLIGKLKEKELEIELLKRKTEAEQEDLWKLIDPECGMTIRTQCSILGIAPSTYYYNAKHIEEIEKSKKEKKEVIDERSRVILEKRKGDPGIGYRKLSEVLRKEGYSWATERCVRTLYSKLGIKGSL